MQSFCRRYVFNPYAEKGSIIKVIGTTIGIRAFNSFFNGIYSNDSF